MLFVGKFYWQLWLFLEYEVLQQLSILSIADVITVFTAPSAIIKCANLDEIDGLYGFIEAITASFCIDQAQLQIIKWLHSKMALSELFIQR